MNNVGGPVEDKIKFFSSYKFSIAILSFQEQYQFIMEIII